MYYNTYDSKKKKNVVLLAVGPEGLMKWEKQRKMAFSGHDSPTVAFDANGVTRRSVQKLDDGSFRMWYEGIDDSGVSSIGVANSADGLKWECAGGEKPVFARNSDSSEWDGGGVGSPAGRSVST